MFAMKRAQILSISKRWLSATAISRPPPPPPPLIFQTPSPPLTSLPPYCNLSPQFTSAGDDKISFPCTATDSPSLFASLKSSDPSKEEKIDCYFKSLALIDSWKSIEVKKVGSMLYKCKTIKQLKQVHLRMLINCLRDDDNCNYLADKVMLLTSDLISFDYAYKVFMYLSSNPNLSSYNILIKCSIGKSDNIAASAYNRMRYQDNLSPDRFTFGFLFKSFAPLDPRYDPKRSDRLKSGKTMHGHVIKLGFVSDTFVMNSLLEFYFRFVINRNQLRAVRKVFEQMPERDIDSWNAMISGFIKKELFFEALSVFDDMLLLGADHRCKPDETTLSNIIFVCTTMNLTEQGKWVDAYIKENKLVLSLSLGNALMEMFLCYDDIYNAKVVFKSMSKKCTITWRRMLDGLVRIQFYTEALLLFDTMMCCCSEEEGGLKPDDDIFLSVLITFHSDTCLVGDGKRLFRAIHKMVHGFGVKPKEIHYSYMIKILAEAGWVEAAMILTESLPWEPDHEYLGGCAYLWKRGDVWASVLYACQIHGNENLLVSWVKKIDSVNSKEVSLFGSLKQDTFDEYLSALSERYGDVKYAKLMVESLITKLSGRYDVDWLNEYLKNNIRSNREIIEIRDIESARTPLEETHTPLEDDDDVYKVVESLERQLLVDLHDQMMSITDYPCQLAI
ncbi:hypothetical protein CASFOL_003334 [Castilleja foliolosa]|uniref:Pentatricopeptide repeat-containing protein n=1 Tax=Castilleja foliolosa TaxID=1961234 RepID=A0ABD3EGV4_9LAMI